MIHAVFRPLFSEIKRARRRAEADGKVAEVEGWLWRKGWQQRSLKMCCFSVTWRRPCHSSFFCLITHLSLRYTARRQGCWRDCDTDRKRERKNRNETACFEQFNLTHSIWLNSIHLFIFCARLFLFRVADNSIQFSSLLSFSFSLCLSEHSHLTTALPISSTRHSLTTSTPHSAGPTGTHTNSVCLSSPDGHGIGKRDG